MPPAAGLLTALGELGLRIGRRDRSRATGGKPEHHDESEGANHTPRVTALAGVVKRRGTRGEWRAPNWGGAPQGEAECHITRERGARALSSSPHPRVPLERPAHGTSIALFGDGNLITEREGPP